MIIIKELFHLYYSYVTIYWFYRQMAFHSFMR